MRTLLSVVCVLMLAVVTSTAGTITVDCNGGADYTNLQLALNAAGPGDTVLVAPCVYSLLPLYPYDAPEWAIELTPDSPTIIGTGGAEVTILDGGGGAGCLTAEDSEIGGRVDMHGLTFRNFTEFGTHVGPYSGVDFTDNIVEYCDDGIYFPMSSVTITGNISRYNGGTGIYGPSSRGTVEGNEVYENDGGISVPLANQIVVRGNHVHHNTLFGVAISHGGQVLDNVIEYNGTQGVSAEGSGTVRGNTIRGNDVGVFIWDQCNLVLHENGIYGNSSCDLTGEGGGYLSPCTLDATMNWWGTTDSSEIAAHILDRTDDAGIYLLAQYDPWCTTADCEEPSPATSSSWGTIKALYR